MMLPARLHLLRPSAQKARVPLGRQHVVRHKLASRAASSRRRAQSRSHVLPRILHALGQHHYPEGISDKETEAAHLVLRHARPAMQLRDIAPASAAALLATRPRPPRRRRPWRPPSRGSAASAGHFSRANHRSSPLLGEGGGSGGEGGGGAARAAAAVATAATATATTIPIAKAVASWC
eukprot:108937-Pleurochrysis_carterae.AAC.2